MLAPYARDVQASAGGDIRDLLMLAHQRHIATSLLHQRGRDSADGARANHDDAYGIHHLHFLPDGVIVSWREEKGKAGPTGLFKKLPFSSARRTGHWKQEVLLPHLAAVFPGRLRRPHGKQLLARQGPCQQMFCSFGKARQTPAGHYPPLSCHPGLPVCKLHYNYS